jgi:hypothetical protein
MHVVKSYALREPEIELLAKLNKETSVPKSQIVAFGIRLAADALRAGEVDTAALRVRLGRPRRTQEPVEV